MKKLPNIALGRRAIMTAFSMKPTTTTSSVKQTVNTMKDYQPSKIEKHLMSITILITAIFSNVVLYFVQTLRFNNANSVVDVGLEWARTGLLVFSIIIFIGIILDVFIGDDKDHTK